MFLHNAINNKKIKINDKNLILDFTYVSDIAQGFMKSINNDNKFLLEINFKIQMKDYRLRFVTRKAWILSIILIFNYIRELDGFPSPAPS